MATRKHFPANGRGHKQMLDYLIDSGWESHPYVRDHRAKQAKNSKRPTRRK